MSVNSSENKRSSRRVSPPVLHCVLISILSPYTCKGSSSSKLCMLIDVVLTPLCCIHQFYQSAAHLTQYHNGLSFFNFKASLINPQLWGSSCTLCFRHRLRSCSTRCLKCRDNVKFLVPPSSKSLKSGREVSTAF